MLDSNKWFEPKQELKVFEWATFLEKKYQASMGKARIGLDWE